MISEWSGAEWKDAVLLPICKGNWSVEGLERVILAAVEECALRCCRDNDDRYVITTLSGGVDSSTCTAMIRKIFPFIPIYSFTIGFSATHPDILAASEVSICYSTFHHELIPTSEEKKLAAEEFKRSFRNREMSLGDLAVFMLYKHIQGCFTARSLSAIAHDGIDELLGGYWQHRDCPSEEKRFKAFERCWHELPENHLVPLGTTAKGFSIKPIFPYLTMGVVEYISQIPLQERTSFEESKIPLRRIAEKYLPREIIERQKLGFCSALEDIK
jgi:asparagine synthetase B (glutamine-hydrolysing)